MVIIPAALFQQQQNQLVATKLLQLCNVTRALRNTTDPAFQYQMPCQVLVVAE
jgi:hypothetical protein